MSSDIRHFTVKELADLAGISPSALRAWEKRFSIFSPERTQGGHRLYTLDDLKVLWYVRRQQNLGKDLKDIAHAGREALLGEALLYFDTQSASAPQQDLSQTESILEALHRSALADAAELLEALSVLSPSPRHFAEKCHHLVPLLMQARASDEIPPLALSCALTTITALMQRTCLGSPAVGAPLALLATLSGSANGLGSLWLALHLREWGFRILDLGNQLTLEDLHEYVLSHPPRILAIGAPPCQLKQNFELLTNDVAMLTAPYALTFVTAADMGQKGNQELTLPISRFFHIVTPSCLCESEQLACMRLKDDRPPAQIMMEFMRKNTQVPADNSP